VPRAMWKGSVSFGLVHIPVRMVTAVRDKTVRFHRLSEDGSCRLRTKLYCPETEEEYDFSQTARGFEVAPDQYVLVADEEIESLRPEAGHSIDIEDFVDLDEIDPVYYDRPYYLVAAEGGTRPYRLLVEALEQANKVGIARFVLRDKQHLAALRVSQGGLCLHTMHYFDEVGKLSDAGPVPTEKVDQKQVDLALNLVEALTRKFDPKRYRDTFRDELLELIEKKAEGKEIEIAPSHEPEPTKVVDLMEVLKRSLGQVGTAGAKTTKKTAAKKSAAKKTSTAKKKAPARARAATRAKKSA
jgi:DNA end-binding protein Ku